jgi:hypothetical protein
VVQGQATRQGTMARDVLLYFPSFLLTLFSFIFSSILLDIDAQGVVSYANGDKFDGAWSANRPVEGTLELKSLGSTYIGLFSHGKVWEEYLDSVPFSVLLLVLGVVFWIWIWVRFWVLYSFKFRFFFFFFFFVPNLGIGFGFVSVLC